MKSKLILGALAIVLVPAAYSQCCGFGMSYDNVVVWPQPAGPWLVVSWPLPTVKLMPLTTRGARAPP